MLSPDELQKDLALQYHVARRRVECQLENHAQPAQNINSYGLINHIFN